ncbi:hypothetical protein [Blastococcus sp. CCUG 61487]|uniref:hypothetical protein n=1 Tax=Blastococcus sp. CCUG 61487 TaxID=1840703 RepID=UPI0010C0387B|nr:hypothetical protein [Blastococcus sp. CCUG 61487]
MEFLQDQLPNLVVGIVSGLLAGVISGLWVARIIERREQQRQARLVTASITPIWESRGGLGNTRALTGGYLTVKNSSDWPVRNVHVLEPEWIGHPHWPYLGPGREHVDPVSLDLMEANGGTVDLPVTLQITDVRGRTYQWRATTDELFDSSWIPVHSRPVQWLARQLPPKAEHILNKVLFKLPEPVMIWLWGYHPATGERRSKNSKGQPLI